MAAMVNNNGNILGVIGISANINSKKIPDTNLAVIEFLKQKFKN